MGGHSGTQKEKFIPWAISIVFLELIIICTASGSDSCPFSNEVSSVDDHHHHHHHGGHSHGEMHGFVADDEDHSDHHGCGHSHFHDHDNEHHGHHHEHEHIPKTFRLPEELEEEEDLRLHGFGSHYHDHGDHEHEHLSTTGLWLHAMGSSLLVSMASLICLLILPLILLQGKPSKTVVDLLAAFGAGAMLGDSFLHQLPHALGGSHNHSHTDSLDDGHNHIHSHNHNQASIDSHGPSHAHSLEDLSVGLAALAGILLFFLVEKVVRYVEERSSQGVHGFHHGHHHHHKSNVSSKKDEEQHGPSSTFVGQRESSDSDEAHESKSLDANADADVDTNGDAAERKESQQEMTLRKRSKSTGVKKFEKELSNSSDASTEIVETVAGPSMPSSASNMVIGYLNLFSDGVHNFTDGMALGSAFLLHGSVGGWSRTLFLLAHELPQEIGDFGILVGSGFSVFKALFFNFLSALVALAGTALALLIGKDTGHSSWIEGFTAGGFIYIAMVGVLPEMHHKGTSFKSTLLQLISLMSGMGVALWISLIE